MKVCKGTIICKIKNNLHSWCPVANPRHNLSVAAVETWRQKGGPGHQNPEVNITFFFFIVTGVKWMVNKPLGGGTSTRREWMSSTASVSSIYRNHSKLLHFHSIAFKYKNHISFWIHTSRTKASFLPWERSSSDSSSELSEWERNSLDLCLCSGIGEPTASSVSSYKQRQTMSEWTGYQGEHHSSSSTLPPTHPHPICPGCT